MEPLVVGLLGITHPHASARVRTLREIEGVEVVAAADDDPRLKYFTDKYDMEPRDIDGVIQDGRIWPHQPNGRLAHHLSVSKPWKPALDAGNL
ncbi:hypothetical protein ACFVTE_16460 [Arthrobacter sp. NPDC058097]|uniref:hypothetical protein n=1 Tax=Arthrobacter sp. NPDC058097 TaxID=3346340 RepID=UPI0036DE8DE8